MILEKILTLLCIFFIAPAYVLFAQSDSIFWQTSISLGDKPAPISSVVFSPSGTYVAATSRNKIYIYHVPSGTYIDSLSSSIFMIRPAFASDDTTLFLPAMDSDYLVLQRWNFLHDTVTRVTKNLQRYGDIYTTLHGCYLTSSPVTQSIALSTYLYRFGGASQSYYGEIYLYKETEDTVRYLGKGSMALSSFSDDGSKLVTPTYSYEYRKGSPPNGDGETTTERSIVIYNLAQRTKKILNRESSYACISPSGNRLIDSTGIIDIETGSNIHPLSLKYVNDAVFLPGEKYIVVGLYKGFHSLGIQKIPSGSWVLLYEGSPASAFTVNSQKTIAATGTETGGLTLWKLPSVDSLPVVSSVHSLPVKTFSHSPTVFPNPVPNDGTTVHFSLEHSSPVRMDIVDMAGIRVCTLTDAIYPAGSHILQWRTRADNGNSIAPGYYLLVLHTDSGMSSTPIVLLH